MSTEIIFRWSAFIYDLLHFTAFHHPKADFYFSNKSLYEQIISVWPQRDPCNIPVLFVKAVYFKLISYENDIIIIPIVDTHTEAIWRVTYISCRKLVLALNMKTNISTIFVQFRPYQQVLQFILYCIGHVILNLLLRSHISTDHDRIDCSLSDITNSQALNPNIRTYCAIQSKSNYECIDSDSPCVSCQSSACCYADKVFSSTIHLILNHQYN